MKICSIDLGYFDNILFRGQIHSKSIKLLNLKIFNINCCYMLYFKLYFPFDYFD